MDWIRLLNKQSVPPFIPNVSGPADIKYFSREFTNSPARDSLCFDPNAQAACSPTYDGFSFTASPPSSTEQGEEALTGCDDVIFEYN